jgi:hypothetical protein
LLSWVGDGRSRNAVFLRRNIRGTSIPGRVGISWEATKSLVSGDGNMIWTVDFHNIPLCGFSDVKFLPFVSPCPQFTVWLLSCSYFPQISFVLILTYNSLLPFPRTWVPHFPDGTVLLYYSVSRRHQCSFSKWFTWFPQWFQLISSFPQFIVC